MDNFCSAVEGGDRINQGVKQARTSIEPGQPEGAGLLGGWFKPRLYTVPSRLKVTTNSRVVSAKEGVTALTTGTKAVAVGAVVTQV